MDHTENIKYKGCTTQQKEAAPISALGAEGKNATALGAERIIWMNDHDDDPRATPSCASFMFKKSHGVMLIALYLVAL